jgi:hypothetical protein
MVEWMFDLKPVEILFVRIRRFFVAFISSPPSLLMTPHFFCLSFSRHARNRRVQQHCVK